MLSPIPERLVCNNCAATKADEKCEDCIGNGCACPCNRPEAPPQPPAQMERCPICNGTLDARRHCLDCNPQHKPCEAEPIPQPQPPRPMVLFCPDCGEKHVDLGEWATKPHKTHQCQRCKHEWRPFDSPTVGVVGPIPVCNTCGFEKIDCRCTAPKPQPMSARGNHKLDTNKHVFFYEQEFYVLSNFSAFRVRWKSILFDTSEAAYHWMKFPNEPSIQEMIRNAGSAHDAFKIAEKFKERRRANWDSVKVDIMREILRAKVQQHEYVRRKLLETGNRELIEDSWRDEFWGWGQNRDGKNMLGKLWMEIRAELAAHLTAEKQGSK